MICVAVVEDNDTIREGLKILIDSTDGYSCVGVYSECDTMLKNIGNLKPDVLLIDLVLPGMNGIEGIKRAKSILPDLTILVLTIYEENDQLFDALCAGACGYLVKKTPPKKLIETINDAFHGGALMSSAIAVKVIKLFDRRKNPAGVDEKAILTQSEKEILNKLVDGSNFKAIADSLFISTEKVRFYFRNIYKKLHVYSQSEVVVKAVKDKII